MPELHVRNGRTLAGRCKHGRLCGAGVILASGDLAVSLDWQEEPSGSIRSHGASETFPLDAVLASPEAQAVQRALTVVLQLARTVARAAEDGASGVPEDWASGIEADTVEVVRLVGNSQIAALNLALTPNKWAGGGLLGCVLQPAI